MLVLERQNRGSGAKLILELNMKHALVKALGSAKKEDRAQDVDDLANLLLAEACILDGEIPSDPAAFARRLNDYVVRALRGAAATLSAAVMSRSSSSWEER